MSRPVPADITVENRRERLFVIPLEAERARLASIPFLARGMSFGDVVRVRDGRIVEVLEKGGHATFRIRMRDFVTPASFEQAWAPFRALGCAFESTSAGIFAIDVPPEADRAAVRARLEQGASEGDWDLDPADP